MAVDRGCAARAENLRVDSQSPVEATVSYGKNYRNSGIPPHATIRNNGGKVVVPALPQVLFAPPDVS